jgi:hypothetical protein
VYIKNWRKNWNFLTRNIASLFKKDHRIGFLETRQSFHPNLGKIAVICDHIIDPSAVLLKFSSVCVKNVSKMVTCKLEWAGKLQKTFI